MYKLGINSNNECGKSARDVFNNIKTAGFTDVMISFKANEIEETILQAKESGLNIPFVHFITKHANDLWAKGESNIRYINEVIEQIKICGKYNIPVAVMHGTVGGASELALPPSKHGVESMLKILKVAEECNVKIALENLDKPNFEQFTYLLDNINSKWLGLCYDAGHHNLYAPEVDILEKYGDRILAVHLHDNLMDWEYGYDYTRDLHYLPFDGKVDFEKVCKNLAKTGYDSTIMLEVHKKGMGSPRLYDETPVDEYLQSAYTKAETIANMIQGYKEQNNNCM